MNKLATLLPIFSLLLVVNNVQAKQVEQIVCKTSAGPLSQQFAHHWNHTWPEWWASWAHEYMSGKMFTGGMRTIENKKPQDKNPHLRFIRADVGTVDDIYIAICRYQIGNREFMDIDNMLEMRVMVPSRSCEVVSNNTIQCSDE